MIVKKVENISLIELSHSKDAAPNFEERDMPEMLVNLQLRTLFSQELKTLRLAAESGKQVKMTFEIID